MRSESFVMGLCSSKQTSVASGQSFQLTNCETQHLTDKVRVASAYNRVSVIHDKGSSELVFPSKH